MTGKPRSTVRNRPAKRDRLVQAASELFYEQGVERTTIAEIAVAADVPAGNVYYYFKTKDEIVGAVVSLRTGEVEATFADLETRFDSPAERLKGLVRSLSEHAVTISQRGCPIGSLCTELSKRATGRNPQSEELMQSLVGGAEQQFLAMGRTDARELAIEMIASYQGTAVLAQAAASPEILRREADRVDRWIDGLQDRP